MQTYLLEPKHTSRKSFYGKAFVVIDREGNTTLYSYNTDIATIDGDGQLTWLTDNDNHYTNTTCSHLKEFCRQHGVKYLGKQKMLQLAKIL